MRDIIGYLLSEQQIHPVLLDIGASGSTPKIWNKIARHSIYVGFDPDLREIRPISDGRFYKAFSINEAVTEDQEERTVLFYLTKSPYCSSTLRPDDVSLSEFLFSDLFVVEKEATVRATSLELVLGALSLDGFDWFKTDSQGTDLRLFKSLPTQYRNKVLAIDAEPGLIDAYINEDLFIDVHRELVQNGFWLSRLEVQSTVRMRRATLGRIKGNGIDEHLIEAAVRKTPAWCEARYLRTINSLSRFDFGRREYILLWIFALLDQQIGYCLDLVLEYERLFGSDPLSQAMQADSLSRLRSACFKATVKAIARQSSKYLRSLASFLSFR